MLQCPNCHYKDIGRVGPETYYCPDCFMEITVSGNEMSFYQVEKDGSLRSMDEFFSEAERRLE